MIDYIRSLLEKYYENERQIALVLIIFVSAGTILYIWIHSLFWLSFFPILVLVLGAIAILMRFIIFILMLICLIAEKI